MASTNGLSRRRFLGALAAVPVVGVVAGKAFAGDVPVNAMAALSSHQPGAVWQNLDSGRVLYRNTAGHWQSLSHGEVGQFLTVRNDGPVWKDPP